MQAMSCLLCPTFYGQEEHKWSKLTANKSHQQKQLSAYYYLAREVFQSFPINAVHRKGFSERSLGMMGTVWKAKGAVRGHHVVRTQSVETKCSTIILLFAFHLHLHQMFTLKGIPPSILVERTSF